MDTVKLTALAGGSRVDRSFAFVDLCGFTDFVEQEGDDPAVAELRHLRASLRDIAPLFGVRIDKWLGDGALLVGTETPQLVGATVALHERHGHSGRLLLRAGVAAGSVILLEGDDYTGQPVNLAARLCELAGPGATWAAVENLVLPSWVLANEQSNQEIRGFNQPVPVVELSPAPDTFRTAPGIVSLVAALTRPARPHRQHG